MKSRSIWRIGAFPHVLTWKVYNGSYEISCTILTPSQGDVSLSAENRPPDLSPLTAAATKSPVSNGQNHELAHGEDEEEEGHHFLEGHTALKFLLAGGIAGAGGFILL